jgi:rhodanese-related sulfurtransferase
MTQSKSLLTAVVLGLAASVSSAQPATVANANAPATDVWTHKTKRLDRAAVDALLAKPQRLVVIDVRRPDELTAKGSFPVYLNIQAKQFESALPYIPKDRVILTVSNHAHRAGDAGDLLTSKGFKVAGATGSEDYEAQGGTAVVRVAVPSRPASASAAQ